MGTVPNRWYVAIFKTNGIPAAFGMMGVDLPRPRRRLSWQADGIRMTPTHAGVTRVERELAGLADSCGGCADGWGVLA